MEFLGHWVPMEVMDYIFLLWAVSALIAGAAILWFRRSRRPPGDELRMPLRSRRVKRAKRAKRNKGNKH